MKKTVCILFLALSGLSQLFCQEPAGQPVGLSLSLEQCIGLAGQDNAAVLNAGLDVAAARYQKQEAVAEYFPKVSVNAFAFYAFDPLLELGISDILGESEFTSQLDGMLTDLGSRFGFSPVYSTLKKGLSANVSVMQPVFAGGRIVNGNRMARLGIEAAELQQKIQLRTTAEEVGKGYWQVVSLEEKLKTMEETRMFLDTLYRDVLSATGAGLSLETDLLQVRLKMNEVKSGELQLRKGIRLAKMDFLNSIGVEYNPYSTFDRDSLPYIDDIRLTDELPEPLPPDNYFRPAEEVAASQEETRLLDLSVESKRMERKMAIGEALPQVSVGATYGYNNFIDKGSMDGLVFGMVRIPITDWGKTARKVQRIDSQIQKAENDRDYLRKQILLQVFKLWTDLETAWEQLQVSEENVSMARQLVEQMQSRYAAGMVSVSELLQARTDCSMAEAELLDMKIAYRNAVTAYMDKAGD